MRQETI